VRSPKISRPEFEKLRDKISGGKQAFYQEQEKREEIREVLSDELLQKIYLK
jgi:hypothetical protein